MKPIKIAGACVVAAIVIGTVVASPSYAYVSDWVLDRSLPVTFGPAPTVSAIENSPLTKEMAVLTDQGISPTRAMQALKLQDKVLETHLDSKITAALAGSYAGTWFVPAAARFHIGVTSASSRRLAKRIVAQTGLTASVVETPVRSTWTALIAVQGHWNKKLAKLLADGKATTGIDPTRNAVTVTLSLSVPSAERALLMEEAATASVNILVDVSLLSSFGGKRAVMCSEPFVEKKVYCENTITSGVRIEIKGEGCTAGPLLVEGNETYLLTAAHCFKGKTETPAEGEAITEVVTSAFPSAPEVQKEIGKEGWRYNTKARDTAEIKVTLEGPFTESLPNPVPALMAEWELSPLLPHTVDSDLEPKTGQMICHEGQASGEKCGEVKKLNVLGAGTEHLVETTACSNLGDSGGPYFLRTEAGEILIMGTEVGGPEPCLATPTVNYFEPLHDLAGAAGFGILSTFKKGQKLLTTATEKRAVFLLAEWLVAGTAVTTTLLVQTSVTLLLEDQKSVLGIKAMVLCSGILDGTIGPTGEDEVTELLSLTGVAISLTALIGTGLLCSGQEGCTTGTENDEVWAVNLPWSTLLELVEEGAFVGFVDLILPHTGGGNPGWYVNCATFLGNVAEECTAKQVTAEDTNLAGGVLIAFSEALTFLVGNLLGNCTVSSEKETGNIEESGEETSSEGTLSVSSTG